jgi:hypothetical protein
MVVETTHPVTTATLFLRVNFSKVGVIFEGLEAALSDSTNAAMLSVWGTDVATSDVESGLGRIRPVENEARWARAAATLVLTAGFGTESDAFATAGRARRENIVSKLDVQKKRRVGEN